MSRFATLCFSLALASGLCAQSADVESYRVIGTQTGKGPYLGKAKISKEGGAFKLDWEIGTADAKLTTGYGLLQGQRFSVAFGDVMLGLMALTLQNDELFGKTISVTKPSQVTNVRLKLTSGTPSDGVFTFVQGGEGTLTIQPRGENPLIGVAFIESKDAKVEGLTMWTGDVLQIVPAKEGGTLGVLSYSLGKDDSFHGVWTSGEEVSLETLKPSEDTKPASDPRGLPFDKQGYYLVRNVTIPGGAVSEEREYLRMGETRENYSKMISFRRYKTDILTAEELSQALMLTAKEDKGLLSAGSVESGEDLAGHTLIFRKDDKSAFHLTFIHREPGSLTSTHLVIRNKDDLATDEKFTEHIQKNLVAWIAEMKKIAAAAPYFIRLTASMPVLDTTNLKKENAQK